MEFPALMEIEADFSDKLYRNDELSMEELIQIRDGKKTVNLLCATQIITKQLSIPRNYRFKSEKSRNHQERSRSQVSSDFKG